MNKTLKHLAIVSFMLSPSFASAQAVIIPVQDESKAESYVGLNWELGSGYIPDIELGYRNVDIDADGDVDGYGASLTLDIEKMSIDKALIKGITGKDDYQAVLGAGYSFSSEKPVAYIGAQGNHIGAGIAVDTSLEADVSIGINSISDYD